MRLTLQLALPSERCQELGNDDALQWRGPLQISSYIDMKHRPAHTHTHKAGKNTHTIGYTPLRYS